MTDSALMCAIAAGDDQAMVELDSRFRAPLEQYISKMTNNSARVEDAVQATIIAAWKHSGSFNERASLWTWLRTIARNVMVDDHRKSERELTRWKRIGATVGKSRTASLAVMESDTSEQRVRADFVKSLLGMLTDRQRAVVTSFYFRGLSATEIAQEQGIGRSLVKNELIAARAEMKRRGMSIFSGEM